MLWACTLMSRTVDLLLKRNVTSRTPLVSQLSEPFGAVSTVSPSSAFRLNSAMRTGWPVRGFAFQTETSRSLESPRPHCQWPDFLDVDEAVVGPSLRCR